MEHTSLARLLSLPSVDAEYRFGRPTVYLNPHELARLTIARSRLGDTRAERLAEQVLPQPARRGRPANRC